MNTQPYSGKTHNIRVTALLLLLWVGTALQVQAQPGSMGIGTTTPDSSARLDIAATNKGLLIPRMTTLQRSSIAKPATGLLVYQTDASAGFYYYNGASWYSLTNGVPVDTTGTVGPTAGVVVRTLAGNGTGGYADGTGMAASFYYPTGIAVDAGGNVYVADQNNNRIRKITPGGVVSTFAGSGNATYADGTGTAASFNYPTGVAVDSGGNMYVADQYNNRIRKITPGGVVTTLAGNGTQGYADGAGTAASFSLPVSVAVDGAGNMYVTDQGNNRIRKITPAGAVTTLAGSGAYGYVDGAGTAASFRSPGGVAVDARGNVYVADQDNNCIRRITPAGVVTTLAGSGTAGYADGTGTTASFYNPFGVAVDAAGNVYVVDVVNNRIRRITPAGVVTTLAGSGSYGYTDGTGTVASFRYPGGVAVDAGGNLYIADYGNHRIRTILRSTSIYATSASLSDYATTASLSNYATTASLSNYATTASLSNYATTASLNGYVATGTPQTISGAKTLTAPLLVNTTGNGNTTPQADMDIQGDTMGLRNAAGWDNLWFNVTGYSANINASGADSGIIFKVGGNSSGTYGNGQALTNAMIIQPNGNVGIGTLAPPSRLSIDGGGSVDAFTILKGGNTRIYDNAGTSSSAFYVTGPTGAAGANKGVFSVLSDGKTYSFTGTGGTVSSDERLKQDIQPIAGSLAKLQQLHGYSYRYKSKGDGSNKEVGVLAQEVQKVLPEAVYQGSDSMYSVSYTALVPLLINAVKEQQQQIVQSREEAAREKAVNRQLQLRLQAIEAALKGKGGNTRRR